MNGGGWRPSHFFHCLWVSEPVASWDSSSHPAQAEFIRLVGSAQKWWNHTWSSPFAEGFGTTGQAAAASISKLLSVADFSLLFLFLQDVVNHTHKENADFGLSISGINKGSGEENVRPQKVSGTHEANTEWGISLFFLKMKNFEC